MKKGLIAAGARLLLLQGSWSYDRLQGIGAAVAIEPLLRDLPGGPGGEAYRLAMGRAVQPFNTHPYLAGLAIGAVARAEHSGAPGARIDRLRAILKGPLGSIGDRLVWAGTLPLASAIGVTLASLGRPVVGVCVFLAVFNAVHLALRVWGLGRGWSLGMAVAKALGHPVFRVGMRFAGAVAALAIGVAVPIAAHWLTSGFDGRARLGTFVVAAVGVMVGRWLAPTVGSARLGFAAIAAVLVAGWLWA